MSTCLTSVFSSEYCRRHIQGQKPDTAQKMKFSIKDLSNKYEQIHSFVDLVTFTREIFNGKFYFLCSVTCTYFLNSPKLKGTYLVKTFPLHIKSFLVSSDRQSNFFRKNSLKNSSRSAVLHTKTRACLKYFAHDCRRTLVAFAKWI